MGFYKKKLQYVDVYMWNGSKFLELETHESFQARSVSWSRFMTNFVQNIEGTTNDNLLFAVKCLFFSYKT
jgi:hypothetical protein